MAESAAPSPGRIFISYRREETAYPAAWLYDRLADRYGGQVFKDVDTIQLGDNFVEMITAAVGSCDVLLALIGDKWLTITDADGRRRLDDPADFVRVEIEAGLTRNIRVIPILVGGATMPRADELPASLAGLVRRHALELSPARFEYDTALLLGVLDRTLAEVRTEHDDEAVASALAAEASDQTTTQLPPAQLHKLAVDSPDEPTSGAVFISYRRTDSAAVAGRMYDRLTEQLDESSVFMDVDSIELGLDFQGVIDRHIAQCDVFLVLIGDRWLDATDGRGNRRLDDPDDTVRIEIESALKRDIRVIPVLIDTTDMPHRNELPESLAPLARRNGTRVRHEYFRSDVLRLIELAKGKTRPSAT